MAQTPEHRLENLERRAAAMPCPVCTTGPRRQQIKLYTEGADGALYEELPSGGQRLVVDQEKEFRAATAEPCPACGRIPETAESGGQSPINAIIACHPKPIAPGAEFLEVQR